MKGHDEFKRCIEFSRSEVEKFIEIRNWCWDQWGPGCEIDNFYKIQNPNKSWCWLIDEWRTRIYFASDKEVQWFHLKWN